MRAAILEDSRKLVVRDVPDPVADKDEVLVEVQYCGICGSDLHIYEYGSRYPVGHEWSGAIAETGLDVEAWEVGDRVAYNPNVPCEEGCYWCKRGQLGLCDKILVGAMDRKVGAFSTYAKRKPDHLHELPDSVTYEEGALVEPTSIALHAINISGTKAGDVIAVLGLGPVGQLVARLAKLGAKAVYGTEISQSRMELARNVVDEVVNPKATDPVDRILELTDGLGPDIVFECAGKVETIQDSIALARKGGTMVVVSNSFHAVETSFMDIVLKGLTIKGSINRDVDESASALNLIKNKKIDVISLIIDKFPLEDINEAFEKALKGEGGKILIKP